MLSRTVYPADLCLRLGDGYVIDVSVNWLRTKGKSI
jgi:hypothetical protein